MQLFKLLQDLLNKTRAADFLGPVALRIYLAPIFIYAGLNKLQNVDNVISIYTHKVEALPFRAAFQSQSHDFH